MRLHRLCKPHKNVVFPPVKNKSDLPQSTLPPKNLMIRPWGTFYQEPITPAFT